jgi:5-methylthioadenosine/S-adenosylhomocysteine deaminase
MRRTHIGIVLTVVIGVVAAGYGQALGAGYLMRNASLVLTMDPSLGDESVLGQLENADVLIVGDKIAAVGVNLAAPSEVTVIDARGMIVMPGFVDTHDHLWQCLIRGCATDGHLFQWLGRCVFPLTTSPINEADGYAGTRLAAAGLIKTGVTTVVDWNHTFNFGFARGSVRALNDSRLRYAFAMVPGTADGSDLRALRAQFIDPNPLGRLQVAGRTRACSRGGVGRQRGTNVRGEGYTLDTRGGTVRVSGQATAKPLHP